MPLSGGNTQQDVEMADAGMPDSPRNAAGNWQGLYAHPQPVQHAPPAQLAAQAVMAQALFLLACLRCYCRWRWCCLLAYMQQGGAADPVLAGVAPHGGVGPVPGLRGVFVLTNWPGMFLSLLVDAHGSVSYAQFDCPFEAALWWRMMADATRADAPAAVAIQPSSPVLAVLAPHDGVEPVQGLQGVFRLTNEPCPTHLTLLVDADGQVFFARFACAYDAARRWNMTANSTLPEVDGAMAEFNDVQPRFPDGYAPINYVQD